MNKTKIKRCQNCQSQFQIEPEDFEFYKKIDVPEPTFCPECRMQRRMIWRNDYSVYKRKCDFSGKDIFTIYRPDNGLKVYGLKVWNSDKWDVMDYGREYDFSRSFFEQFGELVKTVPWPNKFLEIDSVNCDHCSGVAFSKNCYLSICNSCEDCSYVEAVSSNNCLDSFFILKSENCYENISGTNNYNVFFSQNTDNCIDSAFLYNCHDCQNCFGCVNLRHKKYHIFNEPYSKSDYQKEISKYDLSSQQNLEKIKDRFSRFKIGFPCRFANIFNSYNVTGDYVKDANNCHYCFYSFDTERKKSAGGSIEDCKFVFSVGTNTKDSYDVTDVGTGAELIYEGVTIGLNARQSYFSINIVSSYNVQYSNNCQSSSDIFGCIGLRHKKYCILNRQYTKKEYEELIPKIKKHMNDIPYTDEKGRVYKYGEFFPIELSPFAYNESMIEYYLSLTKKEALRQGYSWYDRKESGYKPTIKAGDLPDNIKDIGQGILKETIECANSLSGCKGNGVFRIIPHELSFLRKHNIALPRFCPACRLRERNSKINPLKLYHRQCQCAGHQDDSKTYQNIQKHPHHKGKHCPNKFKTTYALDRKEIVYCEKCYQKEVE